MIPSAGTTSPGAAMKVGSSTASSGLARLRTGWLNPFPPSGVLAHAAGVDEGAAREVDLGLDRGCARAEERREVLRRADIVDDRLDDAVGHVPVADATFGVGGAEEERRVARGEL